ncbi:DUF2878 domain-containing protein [Simiduia agarivorans]|uniref:DUF2878 domain-containing protein n=1 Tax=Simiduia agarivorans (strain DSM 21679 / JCM 13881 / BCRC 17597 / SA1) TaxID=1117647 RepID=R9S613_SIMAS|nr:hypothetical protein M5M_07927 [Simiduia agarivorans SA1 = DSM 21679]
MALWINAISFQLAWWGLVLYQEALAFPVLLVFSGIHFFWVVPRMPAPASRARYWLWTAAVLSIGLGIDLTFFQVGLLSSPEGFPIWLLCLWICFVLSLPVCMRWFLLRPIWGIPALAIGGPLTYLGGMQFSNIVPGLGMESWLIASLIAWSFLACVGVLGFSILGASRLAPSNR